MKKISKLFLSASSIVTALSPACMILASCKGEDYKKEAKDLKQKL